MLHETNVYVYKLNFQKSSFTDVWMITSNIKPYRMQNGGLNKSVRSVSVKTEIIAVVSDKSLVFPKSPPLTWYWPIPLIYV